MNRKLPFSWPSAIASLAVMFLLVCLASTPAAAQSPSVVGQWSSVMSWSVEAIHMNVLPNGKVMIWGPYGNSTIAQIWDPVLNTMVPSAAAPYPGFCSAHVQMADGQLMVVGGLVQPGIRGAPDARIYNYLTNTWTDLPDMNDGRYYPTATALPNGDVLALSGNGTTSVNFLPQIWHVATSSWVNLSSAAMALPLYPKMFVAPNGQVFYAGPTPATRYLDTTGTGSWSKTLMPTANPKLVRDYGPAVMYDAGKVLLVGGARPPVASAEIIDLNAATPPATNKAMSRIKKNGWFKPNAINRLIMGVTFHSGRC